MDGEYEFFAGEDGFCSFCRVVAGVTQADKLREECVTARYRRLERDALPADHPVNELADSMCMSSELFGAVLSMATRSNMHPGLFAQFVDDMGADGFLSAQQAAQLIAAVPVLLSERWIHVICARVVDPWRLTSAQHRYGACYYSIDAGAVIGACREDYTADRLVQAVFMNRESLRSFKASNMFDGRNLEALVHACTRPVKAAVGFMPR